MINNSYWEPTFPSIACTSIFALIVLLPIFRGVASKKVNKFDPLILHSAIFFVLNCPFLLLLTAGIIPIPYEIAPELANQYFLFKYLFCHLAYLLSLRLGLRFTSRGVKLHKFLSMSNEAWKTVVLWAIILSLLALLSLASKNGGFLSMLGSLNQRAKLLSGNGYLLTTLGLAPVALCTYFYNNQSTWIKQGLVLAPLTLFTLSTQIILGGRKDTLMTILILVMIADFSPWRKKISWRHRISILSFIVVFFTLIPTLRRTSQDNFIIKETIEKAKENIPLAVAQLSYFPQYSFIVNKYDFTNFRGLSLFKDLLYAPVPRRFFPDKPPVDEGVYVANEVLTMRDFDSGTPLQEFPIITSWPPETFGNGFMAFGLFGAMLFGFCLGRIIKFFYATFRANRPHVLTLYFYGYVMLNFELSNIRIVQTMETGILILGIFTVGITSKKLIGAILK